MSLLFFKLNGKPGFSLSFLISLINSCFFFFLSVFISSMLESRAKKVVVTEHGLSRRKQVKNLLDRLLN